MDIRCDHCGETGPPAEVTPAGDEGMVVRCQHCGEKSLFSSTEASSEEVESSEEATRSGADLGDLSLEEVMPEPGRGDRCPKCAGLIDGSEFCPHCGLDQSVASRDVEGTPPWIDTSGIPLPEQKEAKRLWVAFEEDETQEALDEFVQFCSRIGLEEFAIGKLRFWLGRHPDDERAKEGLEQLLSAFEKQLWGANKALKAERKDFQREVSDYREKFLMAAVIFWSLITILIIYFGF